MPELVTIKTRMPKSIANKLRKVAAQHERTIAAELRVIIDRHLEAHAPSRKDGPR